MKTMSFLFLLSLVGCATHYSTRTIEQDKKEIKSFAGCYEVRFQFTETFPLEKGYKNKAPYTSGALEYIVVDHESKDEVELQHILIGGKGEKKHILKHWRQEWKYAPEAMFSFKGGSVWEKEKLNKEKGVWLQRVTQVDDSPRYECAASWVDTSHHSFWECQSWNPLPRREYTKRSDYQVIERMNRQRHTEDGWIHEQDSYKLKLVDGKAVPFVKERGENLYIKTDDALCEPAKAWWEENKEVWKGIRAAWNKIRLENNTIKLAFKDEEGDLWQKLFKLNSEAIKNKWDSAKVEVEAEKIINTYR